MRSQGKQTSYRFGDFVLDLRRAHLRRGEEEIELRPQSWEVLKLLVANAGRLVTRQELHDAVWGDLAVTDDSLAHCISDIRKALDDTDRSLIRTVPRRGYVFAGSVDAAVADRAAATVGGHPQVVAAAVALVVIIVAALWMFGRDGSDTNTGIAVLPNSVAVLPFQNDPRSGSAPRRPQLGVAFSDQLRDQLGRVPGLRIAARSSSVVVAGEGLDARAMARRLGVAYIVEGSYFEDRNEVRVSVRLIDGSNGLSLHNESEEARRAELVLVQQRIADEIVAKVLPDAAVLRSTVATRNPSANELMLIARNLEQEVRDQPEVDVPKLLEVVDLYRQATELDPSSALAFSRLADARLYLGDVEGAEVPILRAVSLDPEISDVQDTLGKYLWASRQEGAGAAWERAIELNPNNAEALASYGFWLWLGGTSDVSEEYFRRALSLDRLSLERYWELGNYLGTQGKTDNVRELIGLVKQTFPDPLPYELLSRLHEFLGEVDHAIAWTLRARAAHPDDPVHDWRLAELYSIIGEYDIANALAEPSMGTLFYQQRYDELVELGEDLMFDEPVDVMVYYLLAFGYNATGDFRLAANTLESTGLMDAIAHRPRAEEIEAWMTYMNVLDALGDFDARDELIRLHFDRAHVDNTDWWSNTWKACGFSLAGDREQALAHLERITGSARIPWYPVYENLGCLNRLSDSPEYAEVMAWIDGKRAAQRAAWPETLAEYGVSL